MTFKIREVDHGFKKLVASLKTLKQKDSYVKAGVLGSKATQPHPGQMDNVTLALIHEFGTRNGHIPARPFIRGTFEEFKPSYIETLTVLLGGVYKGKMTIPRALGLLGLKMAADMKKTVTQGDILAPNADSTIKAKGSSRPLVDTGQLVRSVSHEVVIKGGPDNG